MNLIKSDFTFFATSDRSILCDKFPPDNKICVLFLQNNTRYWCELNCYYILVME